MWIIFKHTIQSLMIDDNAFEKVNLFKLLCIYIINTRLKWITNIDEMTKKGK